MNATLKSTVRPRQGTGEGRRGGADGADGAAEKYRVMVVDDSSIIRGFISRYLEEDESLSVVATAANGLMALRNLPSARPDVVVLDIEMPEMDGMTALPKILEAAPDVRVVMASTLTRKNAEISMRAIQLGASDYVPKPESTREVHASLDFRRELVEKVKIYAAKRRRSLGLPLPGGRLPDSARPDGRAESRRSAYTVVRRGEAKAETSARPLRTTEDGDRRIVLRAASVARPELLAIGASTGGPQAVIALVQSIAGAVSGVPVVIVQHMPPTFTGILADHIGRASGLAVKEAEDGETAQRGRVYVAPGGYHMTVRREAGQSLLQINQDPPENFCRPAVDPLLRSLATGLGNRTLAVILTGMGHDGLRGARDLVGAGSTLLAQDEASSVVWGMPGAVATAGLCTAVEPLYALGARIRKLLGGAR